MIASMETYLRRGRRTCQRLLLNPKIRTGGVVLLCGGSGFLLSAASLGNYPQPLAMGLILAMSGWHAAVMSLGAMLGYWVFWGIAGLQGLVWSASGGLLALLLARHIPEEQPLILPAISAFLTALTGLLFQLVLRDTVPVPVYFLRIVMAAGAGLLFPVALGRRAAVTDWLVGGVAVLALAFCLLGLGLQRLPGVSFSGKLSWGLALVCLVLLGLSRLSRRHRGWKILLRIAQIGLAALVLGLSAVEVWVIRAGHRDESAQPADAVIVLGAGVNGTTPSVALQTRIDAAERYLKAHPDIPAVLSGGQGPGEDISEARAMYNALTDRGIDPERLILEEQSANTRQNLQNSLALLPDDYHKTVAIVTNDFHMGRVRLLLNAAGPGRVVQVPAKLPWWWLSANYYLRESFAVVNDQVVRPLLA